MELVNMKRGGDVCADERAKSMRFRITRSWGAMVARDMLKFTCQATNEEALVDPVT